MYKFNFFALCTPRKEPKGTTATGQALASASTSPPGRSEIRRRFGLEAAQVIRGNSSAEITDAVYAERDLAKAMEIMKAVGSKYKFSCRKPTQDFDLRFS